MIKTIKTEVFDTTTIKRGDIYKVIDTTTSPAYVTNAAYVIEVTKDVVKLQSLKTNKVLVVTIENKNNFIFEELVLVEKKTHSLSSVKPLVFEDIAKKEQVVAPTKEEVEEMEKFAMFLATSLGIMEDELKK